MEFLVPDQQHKEKWIQHDYELVDGMYETDLKAALEMSKVEFEQTKFEASVNMISSNEAQDQNGDNHPNREQDKKHKERKKGKGIKLSLEVTVLLKFAYLIMSISLYIG